MGQERYSDAYVCPCGKGRIRYDIISWDNRYSKDHVSLAEVCQGACSGKYSYARRPVMNGGSECIALDGATRAELKLKDAPEPA
jgi:hypothetical protein